MLVKLNGATAKAAGATLKSFITHPGRAAIMSADGNPSDFVHFDRRTVCEYDLTTGVVQTEVSWGGDAGKGRWAHATWCQTLLNRPD